MELNNLETLDSINENETWFYGTLDRDGRAEITDQNVSNKAQVFLEKQKPKRSLFEESLGSFVVYKRQNDALLKCEQEGAMARVFAFEYSVHHPGQRQYLVSTIERFWEWYKKQSDVSFYELIPQNRPAHLYFDLEFCRETNSDIKEEDLIKDFNDCVCEVLMEMFGIDLNPEKEMLILVASTSTKFSEHIIVHLPDNYLFPSNTSIKSFIQQLKENMLSSGRCLVWNADATKLTTLFDATVYSTKHFSRQQIFFDSLVVPARYNTSEIIYIPEAKNGEYPDILSRERKILTIPTRVPASSESMVCITGRGPTSPFPELDQHIIAVNRRWKDNVSIRQWKLSVDKFTMSRHITYYISNCRFCFNIGREHRSNGVYWITDLDKLHCFQKCFDVDCNGVSSNYFPLPNLVCTSLSTKAIPYVDVTLGTSQIAIQTTNKKVGDKAAVVDNMSKQLLLDVIREARAMNETEIQKRMSTTHRRNAFLEMGEQKNGKSRNMYELTDDELLNAFASFKN